MTTITKQKSLGVQRPRTKTVWIKVSDVVPSKDNTRNFKDPSRMESLKQLAANIKEKGLLHPIVVRPHPLKPGKYDLRAGERRWRAHRLAGLAEIEARIMQMSDLDAEEATFIENFHREQLMPMETAAGIQKLVESKHRKITLKEIGSHLGMTPSTVLRRARLTSLTKEWQKAMNTNAFPGWGVGHYESVARFDTEIQDQTLEEMQRGFGRFDDMTLSELDKFLAGRTRLIHMAAWDPTDESLVPEAGACTKCSYRSGCKPGLFDELYEPERAGKKDRCLNLPCWEKKEMAVHERTKVELQKKHPGLAIVSSYHNHGEQGELPGKESYDPAKKSERGAYRAFLDDGEGKGKLIWAKPKKTASKKAIQAITGKEPGPTPLSQRMAVYTKRRNVYVINALGDHLRKEEIKIPSIHIVLSCAATFGTIRNQSHVDLNSWEVFDELTPCPDSRRTALLWENILPVVCNRLKSASVQQEPEIKEAKRWAEILGLDLTKLEQAALEAIPDPKIWATLNEDGTTKKTKKKMKGENKR